MRGRSFRFFRSNPSATQLPIRHRHPSFASLRYIRAISVRPPGQSWILFLWWCRGKYILCAIRAHLQNCGMRARGCGRPYARLCSLLGRRAIFVLFVGAPNLNVLFDDAAGCRCVDCARVGLGYRIWRMDEEGCATGEKLMKTSASRFFFWVHLQTPPKNILGTYESWGCSIWNDVKFEWLCRNMQLQSIFH